MQKSKKIDDNDIKEIVINLKNQIHNLNKKKILLLGSEGFLGRYFVKVFNEILNNTKNKFSLDCFDNFISSKPNKITNVNKKITFQKKDISNYKFKKK